MLTFVFSITIGFKKIYTIYHSIAGDEVIYKILSKIIPEKLNKNWIFNIIIIILILVIVRFLVP